ncbi:aminotransferase class I/II-fold pyridoxal phosphate-dependent enzyme [Olsenella uli]|uniref:aminotransferase class I/II-fold pyridoxal phosphate-dependent enzyme n=1 Tax=Olsenella uli TaxID=133926 RepID=UPI0024A964DC|nr:aminotransferase class I/II-fold pyridoxal phosphate-dependent enzyme [Olsenella uli]
MEIRDFKVEQWMNAWETRCTHNVAETCTYSMTLKQLFELCGGDLAAFMGQFAQRRLTYGDIEGNPRFLEGVCGLYQTVRPEHVVPTHGAAGANHLVLTTLCGPGDHVVSVMPTYQQLYSIPEMCGSMVDILHLERADHYHVDAEELDALCTDETKVICINNPDNPTGALLSEEEIRDIVGIARRHGAWLVFDEVYRLLVQDSDAFTVSPVDLYDKAIVVSSMSKVWSLAGIRLGWCITKDEQLRHDLLSHRDYDLISCGLLDEEVAAYALAHADKILERSRRIVRQNLATLDEWIASEPHLSYVKPEAGTTALVYYDYDIDSYDFCVGMIQSTGALVTPGDAFEEPRSMRIGYAYSDNVDDLRAGLDAISAYLRTLE